jgi:hypothetical protein
MSDYTAAQSLLYPQTFLFPKLGAKIFPFVSQIVALQLPTTFEVWERFYQESDLPWQEKISFLTLKQDVSIDWETLKKEAKNLQEWGLNFRTPENLKYFSHFKEVLKEALEEISPVIKGIKKASPQEETKIKQALITLLLAEELDAKLWEIFASLEKVDKQYSQIFEEKIIGEDFTFEKVMDIKYPFFDPSLSFKNLSNLSSRIHAWKILVNHLNWASYRSLKSIIITDPALLGNWQEKYDFVKEKDLKEEKIEIYKFKTSLFQLLEIPSKSLQTYSQEEADVIFVTF